MALGVTQNPLGVEACVYLVESYRATWKVPVQEQCSEQLYSCSLLLIVPRGDLYPGLWWLHPRRPGDQ